MIIEYTPEGGETMRLDAGRMRASEIQIIERTADAKWAAIKLGMRNGDINALRTVGFVVRKRSEPSLRISDFDPFEDELRVRLDASEAREYAERLYAQWHHSPEDLADAFDELREVCVDTEACEQAIADVSTPKAPEQTEPVVTPEETPASAASPSES
ncbi:hypothetical protein [Streptomyces sp. NPDC059759]|uniref:hypothetical protein n=1 Tax=Streptomyces sp. NPDC059759 TaxID=3346936 RepID=UPI003647D912